MRNIFSAVLLTFTVSCSTSRLAVPDQFSSLATFYPVKGAKVWSINQHLRFGNYATSRIKRGWNLSSSIRYNNLWTSPQEVLLNIFDIETTKERNNEKGRFRYTLKNEHASAEIFGTEVLNSRNMVFNSSGLWKWMGETSLLTDYKYAFTAAIIPADTGKMGLWSLLMINKYDITKDTARRFFDKPYVEEEGYATNGKDTIRIRALNLSTVVNRNGKVSNTLFKTKILSGYELSTADGVIGIIDTMDKSLWIYNHQEEHMKFIISAMGTAILLKQIEEPEARTTI